MNSPTERIAPSEEPHKLDLNPDFSERLEYTVPDMPVRAGGGLLSIFRDFAAACHWHDDFELLGAVEGELDCFAGGATVHLKEGECVLVNSRRLHYGYSAEKHDCRYRFFLFHPSIFASLPPAEKALAELTADGSADYWKFDAMSDGASLFDELCRFASEENVFGILAKCAELMNLVSESASGREPPSGGEELAALRAMIGFVQAHYPEKIDLGRIAAAGAVCRSRCCLIFRRRLGCSPIEYVTRYRLEKARAMLARGCAVTEAAFGCGFNSASYFAEVFRRSCGMTPKEYRRSMQA